MARYGSWTKAESSLGLLNPDVDIENRVIHIRQDIKEIERRDDSIRSLSPKQVDDLLGHSASQITEMYYSKKDTRRLQDITDGFDI